MELIKTFTSRDGTHRIDIERSEANLYRYITFSDRYRKNEDFHNPPYWTIENFSGLYETAESAEVDARNEFAWFDGEA